MTKLQNLLKGLIKENPVFVLVLGTCPTLAISTSVTAAFGMGIAATAVLILSNMAISALRKVIPDRVRIPCYIVLIAGFVTVVELIMDSRFVCSTHSRLCTCRSRQWATTGMEANKCHFFHTWGRFDENYFRKLGK